MRHPLTAALGNATLLALALLACQREGNPTPQPEPASATAEPAPAAAHARSGAEPGSHADWCGEHQVPESLCSRCNPSLIAAFQATGDWCPEHGLPESQCLRCNPDLKIERPPPPGGQRP